jgi:hypothetical protein
MDGYIPHPPAQDSATAGYSSAAKGGLAGVLVMLLAIVVYVFFKRQNCLDKGDPGKFQVINTALIFYIIINIDIQVSLRVFFNCISQLII